MSRDSGDRSIYEGYSYPTKSKNLKYKNLRKQRKEEAKARADEVKNAAAEKAGIDTYQKEARDRRLQSTEEGRADAQKFFDQDIQGFTPQQRSTMQYGAQRQIERQRQASEQALLGEQGRRGIVGRGGVGYAQRRDLQQMANTAQNDLTRDIDRLNFELGRGKQAAIYGAGAGEAAQADLDRQMKQDEYRYLQERRDMQSKIKNKNFNKL